MYSLKPCMFFIHNSYLLYTCVQHQDPTLPLMLFVCSSGVEISKWVCPWSPFPCSESQPLAQQCVQACRACQAWAANEVVAESGDSWRATSTWWLSAAFLFLIFPSGSVFTYQPLLSQIWSVKYHSQQFKSQEFRWHAFPKSNTYCNARLPLKKEGGVFVI